jgi:glycine dehydrogenase subunit 2
VLIPDTAHGTNPASAALCGFQAVPVKSNPDGVLLPESVAELMDEDTAGIMITNPNTLGLFEDNIRQVADIVHAKGGLVYGDGANMNAVMGIVNIGDLGVDVLHLNLHKTFSTPHGGGGPGSRPGLRHPGAGAVPARAPRGQRRRGLPPGRRLSPLRGQGARLLRQLRHPGAGLQLHPQHGQADLKTVSQYAVLNANYIKERLKDVYHLPYDRPCMHECVFTDKLQQEHHVATLDIAKRLMDMGFIHPRSTFRWWSAAPS